MQKPSERIRELGIFEKYDENAYKISGIDLLQGVIKYLDEQAAKERKENNCL